jgi:hypothetical protein
MEVDLHYSLVAYFVGYFSALALEVNDKMVKLHMFE